MLYNYSWNLCLKPVCPSYITLQIMSIIFSARGLITIHKIYTLPLSRMQWKNRNMLIVWGIFPIKYHTAYHHESIAVYFAGGKCINIHTTPSIKRLSNIYISGWDHWLMQDNFRMGNKIITHIPRAGKHPVYNSIFVSHCTFKKDMIFSTRFKVLGCME